MTRNQGDKSRSLWKLGKKSPRNSAVISPTEVNSTEQAFRPIQTDYREYDDDEAARASPTAGLLVDEHEEDPVELMRQIRRKKNALTKGLGSVTRGVKKGTAKVVKGVRKQKSSPKVNPDDTVASVATALVGSSDSATPEYDLEAPATESQPLVANKRSGASLWGKLRDNQDKIVFSQPEEQEESEEVRKSRRQKVEKEKMDEIRSGLEISMSFCLLAIVVYLGFAVLAYSYIFEKWSIIDSLYFATVTFCTVGYGDIVPTSGPSRLFTSFFALTGVASLGIALGVIGSNLVDAQSAAIHHAKEMTQYRVMSVFESPEKLNQADVEQATAEKSVAPWWRSSLLRVLPMMALLMLCAWVIGRHSAWTVVDDLYFTVITATTIGFGDYVPKTEYGRLFQVFVIPLAVGVMGQWLSMAANAVIQVRLRRLHDKLKSKELTMQDLEAMDANEDGEVSRAEYISFMLIAMNMCDQDLIDTLNEQFDQLDVDGTGILEKEDLIIVAKQKLRCPRRKLQLAEYKQRLIAAGKHPEASSAILTGGE